MESVKYSTMDLLVVARGTGPRRWQRWVHVPATISESAVWTYIEQRFGAPSSELDSPSHGPCPLGLVFPVGDSGLDEVPDDAVSLEVTPHVCFPSGLRVPLVEYRCWLASAFSSITGSPTGTLAPTASAGPLHSEHPVMVHSDPELLELQFGGWVRRMVDDGCTYLTVSLGERGRYVQLMVDDRRRLIAEAVGNRHLDDHQQLTVGEQSELRELGWHAPDDGHANFWAHWDLDGPPVFGVHPSRVYLPGTEPPPRPEVGAAAHLIATTISSVFAADVAHRAAVDVGPVQIDAC